MSLLELVPEYFQVYDLVANPRKVFASSSNGSVTGSIRLYSDFSKSYKDLDPTFAEAESGDPEDQIEATRLETFGPLVESIASGEPVNAFGAISDYMSDVNAQPVGERQRGFPTTVGGRPVLPHDGALGGPSSCERR